MASTIAASTAGGGGIIQTADASGNLSLQSGTTTILALTSTGVAITGTLSATGVTTVAAGSAALPAITTTGDTDTGVWFPAANILAASTAGVEAMRIDSSGAVIVGATATSAYFDGALNVYKSANIPFCAKTDNATAYCIASHNTATSGNNYFAVFLTEASPTIRGSITYNRAGGLTVFSTTSDYRSKTVKSIINNALGKLSLLKPCTGRMNDATEDIDFFVAHELQAIVPSAVIGEKDEVDAEGNPKYQMVDKSAIIPLLTAAIQELKAIIDTQQTQITALNAKVGI